MITLSVSEFFIYFFWACLGQLYCISSEQVKHAPRIAAYGGFSFKIWLKENWARSVSTAIVMVIGVLFAEPVLNMELNELTAFLSGVFADVTADAITNRKKKRK